MEDLEQEVNNTLIKKVWNRVKKYTVYVYHIVEKPFHHVAIVVEEKHKEKYPENSPTDIFTKEEYTPKKQRYSDRIIPK